MMKKRTKEGSLALWLAGMMALVCVASMIFSFTRHRQAVEQRRASPPPIYTESRPKPELQLAPLPELDIFSENNGTDAEENPR